MKSILFFAFLILTIQLFAQNKSVAVKFDEFSDFPAEKVSPLYDRTNRFVERFKREPLNKNAVIIYYNQRKGQYPLKGGTDWGNKAYFSLFNRTGIAKDRIVLIDGGYREYATLEFWVVPEGAEMPKPTPTITKNEVVYCPEIRIAGDGFRHDRNKPLKFSVGIRGDGTNKSFPVEWSVSEGKIINGQGTDVIEIDLSETKAKKITASVIIKGLPAECNAHAFNSTEIGLYPYKFDEFSHLYYSDISARMDYYFIQIANEPASTGYIIVYGSRQSNKKDVAAIMKSLNRIIAFRKYDPSRIKIVDGGFREEMFVEVYLLPAGVEPPKPTPTLNSDFVVEPKRKTTVRRKKT